MSLSNGGRSSGSSGAFVRPSLALQLLTLVVTACILVAPGLALSTEQASEPFPPAESVIFITWRNNVTFAPVWDGNCTGVSTCTGISPCFFPDAPVVVNSAGPCLISFMSGVYSKAQIYSAQKLFIAASGPVVDLQLLVSASDVTYTTYPQEAESQLFSSCLFQQELLATSPNKLTVSRLSLLNSRIIASSDKDINHPINVTLQQVAMTQPDQNDASDFISVTAPETSNGVIGIVFDHLLTSLNDDTAFFYTTFPYPQVTVATSKIIGGSCLFNLTRPQNAKVTISQSVFMHMNLLIAEPYATGRVWTSDNAVHLKAVGTTFSGPSHSLGAIGMFDTCINIVSWSSNWTRTVINCNDYMNTGGAQIHCDMALKKSIITDSNVCIFGTTMNDSTPQMDNYFQFDDSAFLFTVNRTQSTRVDFRNAYITTFEQSSMLTLTDENVVDDGSYLSPFVFTGYVGLDNLVSLTSNALTLNKATLEVQNLTLTGRVTLQAGSTLRARGIKPTWNLSAPLKFNSGLTAVSTVDTSRVSTLSLTFDQQSATANRSLVQLQNTVLYAADAENLASALKVQWEPTGMVLPQSNVNYSLALFTLAAGQSLRERPIPLSEDQDYGFNLVPQVANATLNTWNAFAVLNASNGNANVPCRKPLPNLPGFKCDPKTLYWTTKGDYFLTNTLLIVPPQGLYRVAGDLHINNGTINFQGEDNELSVDGCISWVGKKKNLVADYSQKRTYLPH